VTMKNTIFWDGMPSTLVEFHQCVRVLYYHSLRVEK
jgi:hypothetical protein